MNPFAPLYARCNEGDPAEKLATLADGPLIVDVEPVGLCNFRCVMCPTGLQALGREQGMMSMETFNEIVEQTTPTKAAIRFIGWGEPLMHDRIARMVERAHFHDRLTHINTNGSLLTRRLATALVKGGLDSIKFSFQGTDRESYEAMRGCDYFELLLRTMEVMWLARQPTRMGRTPWIAASTSTTYETPEQIEAFRARVGQRVDELSIGKTVFEFIDMDAVPERHRVRLGDAASTQTVEKRHPDPCPEVFNKLTVHWDGSVRVCCNDYSGVTSLGNINTHSLQEIWRHPWIEEYRERLARKDYHAPLCETCYDYMDCTGKEEA